MRYPFELEVRHSPTTVTLIAAIHLVAAIAFLGSSLAWPLVVAAVAVLAASLFATLCGERRKVGLRLVLEEDGGLRVEGQPGSHEPTAGCTDFGWAVWLQWRDAGTRGRALMLLHDQVDDEAWRALRTWLRHKAFAQRGRPGDGDASA